MEELGPTFFESDKKSYQGEWSRAFSGPIKVHDYNRHTVTIYEQERNTINANRFGNAGTRNTDRGAYYVTKHNFKPTMRQMKQKRIVGPANAQQAKPGAYTIYRPRLKTTIKETTLSSYTPTGGKQKHYNGSEDQNVRLANKLSGEETSRILSRSRTIEKASNVNNYGIVTKNKKDINNLNIQYDPSVLDQLKDNPFVI